MSKLTRKRLKKVGLPPGTLVPPEERKIEKTRITVIDYDETQSQEKQAKTVEECLPFKDKPTVTWINVDGVHDVEIIRKIGEDFGLHPLTLEDIVDEEQRSKIEDFEGYIFITLKMLSHTEKKDQIQTEQVSLVLAPHFVISFQERQGDIFDPIRDRIRTGRGRIRKMGADYLTYALIDTIVDNYFAIPERLGEKIESMEEELFRNPTP